MQSNNKLRVFSDSATNIYTDDELDSASAVASGAEQGAVASSKLYNSLSKTTSLVSTAMADFLASNNTSTTFGQDLALDNWISAVTDTIATTTQLNSAVSALTKTVTDNVESINKSISNITDGTTTVGNAKNVTTNINGKAISTIFESDGTTVQNATNATNAIVNSDNTYSGFTNSSDEQLKAGDYIVEKKKLLWSGDTNIKTTTSIASPTLNPGDLIEVHFNSSKGFYGIVNRVFRVYVGSSGYKSHIYVTRLENLNTSPYIQTCDIVITLNTTSEIPYLSFHSTEASYMFNSQITYDYDDASNFLTAVYKVYQ